MVSPTCGDTVSPGESTLIDGASVWLYPGRVVGLAAVAPLIAEYRKTVLNVGAGFVAVTLIRKYLPWSFSVGM
jgi:hypothetical protein